MIKMDADTTALMLRSTLASPTSNINVVKSTPFTPDLTPEDRPGVKVESVGETHVTTISQQSLTIKDEVKNPIFAALLVWCLLGAAVFLYSAGSNIEIVNIEVNYGNGISYGWFFVITTLLAILTAHMVYRPYILDRINGSYIIMQAVIIYVVAQMFWGITLFHSRIHRGTAEVGSIFLIAGTVWLGWTCYHLVPESIYIFLLLLIWSFYLMNYTFNVDAHPWIILQE